MRRWWWLGSALPARAAIGHAHAVPPPVADETTYAVMGDSKCMANQSGRGRERENAAGFFQRARPRDKGSDVVVLCGSPLFQHTTARSTSPATTSCTTPSSSAAITPITARSSTPSAAAATAAAQRRRHPVSPARAAHATASGSATAAAAVASLWARMAEDSTRLETGGGEGGCGSVGARRGGGGGGAGASSAPTLACRLSGGRLAAASRSPCAAANESSHAGRPPGVGGAGGGRRCLPPARGGQGRCTGQDGRAPGWRPGWWWWWRLGGGWRPQGGGAHPRLWRRSAAKRRSTGQHQLGGQAHQESGRAGRQGVVVGWWGWRRRGGWRRAHFTKPRGRRLESHPLFFFGSSLRSSVPEGGGERHRAAGRYVGCGEVCESARQKPCPRIKTRSNSPLRDVFPLSPRTPRPARSPPGRTSRIAHSPPPPPHLPSPPKWRAAPPLPQRPRSARRVPRPSRRPCSQAPSVPPSGRQMTAPPLGADAARAERRCVLGGRGE